LRIEIWRVVTLVAARHFLFGGDFWRRKVSG